MWFLRTKKAELPEAPFFGGPAIFLETCHFRLSYKPINVLPTDYTRPPSSLYMEQPDRYGGEQEHQRVLPRYG
jgi:hypothetical protein